MFHQHKKSKILPVLITILFFVFVYAPVDTMAQSLYKSKEGGPPGGGGSTTTTIRKNQDKTSTILVLMGVATGLVLIYKFFIQKEDDKKAVKDTTSTSSNVLGKINNYPSIVKKIKNENDQLPFKLYLGIRRDDPIFNNKTYVLGVSFNL